jgi:hypothetical protein
MKELPSHFKNVLNIISKKKKIKHERCDPWHTIFGITVTVCHYTTGASKWNPVDHRLFSFISQNWAGVSLRSYETVLKYIRSTTTVQGLKVKAVLNEKKYENGEKSVMARCVKLISKDMMCCHSGTT